MTLASSNPTHSLQAEPHHADYVAYRVRQARALLRMLPKESIRPLYRRAIADERAATLSDPIAVLVSHLERLLPLPPFDVWAEDVRSNPGAHLDDLDQGSDAPTAAAPATICARPFEYGGRDWVARLRAFRDGGTWRGYIAFECASRSESCITALVFRENRPSDVRARFEDFESESLGAFLRSAML